MNDEMKTLVADAAKLLGILFKHDNSFWNHEEHCAYYHGHTDLCTCGARFNPLDPERGDLMKVAETAGVSIRFGNSEVTIAEEDGGYKTYKFTKGNFDSLAYAILRAASAVLHSRGGM